MVTGWSPAPRPPQDSRESSPPAPPGPRWLQSVTPGGAGAKRLRNHSHPEPPNPAGMAWVGWAGPPTPGRVVDGAGRRGGQREVARSLPKRFDQFEVFDHQQTALGGPRRSGGRGEVVDRARATSVVVVGDRRGRRAPAFDETILYRPLRRARWCRRPIGAATTTTKARTNTSGRPARADDRRGREGDEQAPGPRRRPTGPERLSGRSRGLSSAIEGDRGETRKDPSRGGRGPGLLGARVG